MSPRRISGASMAIVVTLALIATGALAQSQCPSMCMCIWRNGKQTANCENQGLISIPSGITALTQVLSLNKNNFQILPTKVFQERGLSNLQKVFLAECKLGVIAPDAFDKLTNLVELDLSSNLLTNIPSEALEHAKNIRRLQLNGNPIRHIRRRSLAMLEHLNSLELSSCQIDNIEPGAFSGLTKLQFLKLDTNRLSTLSVSVLLDLPPLYLLDLHKNPWNCDCELRAAREWMIKHNVPQSVPPTCAAPDKMSGIMWNTIQTLDEFACAPQIITRDTDVTAFTGLNASFSCTIMAQPEAKIWWVFDEQVKNVTAYHQDAKYSINEERVPGSANIQTTLSISSADEADNGKIFVCFAENSAGLTSKNFTLQVLPFTSHPSYAGWTKVEVAGGIVGILFLVVLCFTLITVFLLRARRNSQNESNKSPLPQIDVLKNISGPVAGNKQGYDDKQITADNGKGLRPETGASSGYGSNGVTPDLTSSARTVTAIPEMLAYHDTSGYLLPDGSAYGLAGHSSGLLQQVPLELKSPYALHNHGYQPNYENYDICDTYNYEQGMPVDYGQPADMQTAYYTEQYQMGTMVTPDMYWHKTATPVASVSGEQMVGHVVAGSVQASPGHSSQQQSSQGAVGGHHVNVVGQGSYNVAHPTVVRYSPDEGYAEEPANGTAYTLEGTEV